MTSNTVVPRPDIRELAVFIKNISCWLYIGQETALYLNNKPIL